MIIGYLCVDFLSKPTLSHRRRGLYDARDQGSTLALERHPALAFAPLYLEAPEATSPMFREESGEVVEQV